MSRVVKKIEYEGEIWTTARMSETFKCHISHAQELLRDVEKAYLTVAQAFGRLKRHRNHQDRKNRKFVFMIKGRKKLTLTMEEVAAKTGLSEESAYRRLIRAEQGKRSPETLLDPPRSARYEDTRTRKPKGRFSHLSSEMTSERKERLKLLEDLNMGLISLNDFQKKYI